MLEILLVFSVSGQPEEISKRIFSSYEECKSFVTELVAENDVVNSDFGFTFYTNDGVQFSGQCIDKKDYQIKINST